MDSLEKLMKANGIESMKRKPDSKRIEEREAENADLKAQVKEAQDALVELAEIITEGM